MLAEQAHLELQATQKSESLAMELQTAHHLSYSACKDTSRMYNKQQAEEKLKTKRSSPRKEDELSSTDSIGGGVSGLVRFDGEDPMANERRKKQAEQMKTWSLQQAREKEDRKRLEKESDRSTAASQRPPKSAKFWRELQRNKRPTIQQHSSVHPKSGKGSLPPNRLYSTRSPPDSSDSEDVENRVRSSNNYRPGSANIGQSYYSKPPITNNHRSTRRQEEEASSDDNIEFLSRELNKKSSRGVPVKNVPVPPSVDSEDKWKSRYHKTQEQLEDAFQKIKDLQQNNLQLTKDLKEARESADGAKESNKKTLERLKTKMALLESSLMQSQKDGFGEIEKENQRLQADVAKMKIELDRAKDTDNLIPHYRLAIMKVRAQSTAMKEKLEQYTQEKKSMKQEMDMIQRALQEAENKNQSLLLQLQDMQEAREQEIHHAEHIKQKLQHEIHELRETRSVTDQAEITRLRNEVNSLEETVYQQKQIISQLENTVVQQREEYNMHLQAAMELATAPEPPKPIPVQTFNYTSDSVLPKYSMPSSTKSKKPKQPFSSRDVMSDTPTVSRPRGSYSPKYQSDSGRGIDNNLTSPGNNVSGSALKKNLETLDEEIQQLAKSLEKASEKLRL